MKWFPVACLALLSACAPVRDLFTRDPAPVPAAPPPAAAALPPAANLPIDPQGRSPEALDASSPAERAEAAAPAAAGALIGTTTASLGEPARQGFWLETPLVSAERPGSVRYNGQSANVTLIPSQSGSRLSLAAMRLIGASLTDLVEIEVYGS